MLSIKASALPTAEFSPPFLFFFRSARVHLSSSFLLLYSKMETTMSDLLAPSPSRPPASLTAAAEGLLQISAAASLPAGKSECTSRKDVHLCPGCHQCEMILT